MTTEKESAMKRAYYQKNRGKTLARQKAYYEKNKEKVKAYREKNRERIDARKKEWYEKNREKQNAYNREWHRTNKEERNADQRAYYHMNKEERREYSRQYCKNNPEKIKAHYRETRETILEKQKARCAKQKFLAIKYYSEGKMDCACCGETRYRTLAFDHINGGGGKHRKELKNTFMPRWLIKNNFPAGFQILCMNCNFTKGKYGICDRRDPIPTPRVEDFE